MQYDRLFESKKFIHQFGSILAMSDQRVDVKVQVTSLNLHYKQGGFIGTLDFAPNQSNRSPPEEKVPEVDPDFVLISFKLTESKHFEDSGSLLVKTLDAKKLGLMVGDKLTLTLIKESH